MEPQTFLRHISHFTIAMIKKKIQSPRNYETTEHKDRFYPRRLKTCCREKSEGLPYKYCRLASCNILSHSRPQIIWHSSRHYQGHTLVNYSTNISSSAKCGIILKLLLCRFILVCHFRLVSPTKLPLQTSLTIILNKTFPANRCVRWETKVSKIISLMTRTETVLETSVHSLFNRPTRLLAWESLN